MLYSFLKLKSIAFCDAPEHWQLGIQDTATASAEGMVFFHDYIVFFLIGVAVAVFWMLYVALNSFQANASFFPKKFVHSSFLEIIWTIIPAVLLFFLAIPSYILLYSNEDIVDVEMTLKIVGHQWYWSYEYPSYKYTGELKKETTISPFSHEFDAVMVPTADLTPGSTRLLEVDRAVILPINRVIRVLITAADVLHSWAVPSIGIKVDACPGRLSQATFSLKREGFFYGQCSEICGTNHGFMPILVIGVHDQYWDFWTSKTTGMLDSITAKKKFNAFL